MANKSLLKMGSAPLVLLIKIPNEAAESTDLSQWPMEGKVLESLETVSDIQVLGKPYIDVEPLKAAPQSARLRPVEIVKFYDEDEKPTNGITESASQNVGWGLMEGNWRFGH